jgi:hypothetical protein
MALNVLAVEDIETCDCVEPAGNLGHAQRTNVSSRKGHLQQSLDYTYVIGTIRFLWTHSSQHIHNHGHPFKRWVHG